MFPRLGAEVEGRVLGALVRDGGFVESGWGGGAACGAFGVFGWDVEVVVQPRKRSAERRKTVSLS